MRPDVKVRLAQDSEAHLVSELVQKYHDMGDWILKFETVFPHWLVAEIAGEIVGTINIRISLPVTSVEMMSIDPKLTKRERAEVALMLTSSAGVLAASMGAEAVSSMIPDDLDSYLEVAQNRGYVIGNHGNIVFGRLR